ncbi:hypothetical protein SASPL_153616 [Salvia splendens]|uniref:Uncharacterized protein n=1 Tax=Salvia splendens TaxID=180675 RepID=A0A8X8VYM2_SALSN|nr:uncharacterized protein LOC121788082 [Salvia splendens]XP_042042889.1 uncharacterized protein LOC121788082 [Salvia splendens]KAG6384798.1 hypothetical protein SASPL_153616 [Salvia splendens]
MSFLTFLIGSTKSWQPAMTVNTTASSYWLNWRVLLCSLWVLMSMVFASLLISRHECRRNSQENANGQVRESPGILHEDEVWRPCLRSIHPGWLLAFRVFAFLVLLSMLILNVAVDGGTILYFYTQWTFTLITIYFGLGSLLSIRGCYEYNRGSTEAHLDTERGKGKDPNQHHNVREEAGFLAYAFQIIFQMNAGAVMLTDSVFWFILVPFLVIKDYHFSFLIINMHSINAVFLLGETALNSLRFPWFRIGYFFLWTSVYVLFQWILHACVWIWWPYPFLDLSSSYAPLWYSTVALMHIPCYGVFVLVMKGKHWTLKKWFPETYWYAQPQ